MLLDEEMRATVPEIPISPRNPSIGYHKIGCGHLDGMGIRTMTAPTRASAFAIVVVCGLLVLGCGRAGSDEPTGVDRGDVELTGDDASRTIEMTTGDSLTMRLESNPGTGFEWEVTVADDAVVALTSTTFEPGQDDEGTPGRDAIVLTATGPGQSEVTFDYRRPWETEVEPEQTLTIVVAVADLDPDLNSDSDSGSSQDSDQDPDEL